ERTIRRVGGTEEIPVDVRVLTATHRDLEALVEQGRFREDLYYRIHVIRIRVPPLRDRREDIPEFVRRLVDRHAERLGRRITAIEPELVETLAAAAWPGNVRELENVIERALALTPDERLSVASLPSEIRHAAAPPTPGLTETLLLEEHLERERRRFMQAALAACDGVQTRAAERLGMTFRSFRYFAKKYGLAGHGSSGGTQETPAELVGAREGDRR
ncbi:MAG: sigma-54-dependent Fis family transcriptional regulator, partial [Acidobacteriota bacterium]